MTLGYSARLGLATAAGLVIGLAAADAQAAPQIVAAMPSNGDLALSCDGERCVAEVSTVCLQRGRAAPPPGERYAVNGSDRAAIAVTGVAADGREMALDSALLDFAALRGQVAFRASLPQAELERLGLAGATLRIERLAMLVPVAEAGDTTPQTAADVARAAGEMAATGGYWLALRAEPMAVARVANRIINRLPDAGSMAPEDAGRLWSDALAPEAALVAKSGRDSVVRARHMIEHCRASALEPGQFPMRRCVARFHDRLLQDLNRNYWDALKPQS